MFARLSVRFIILLTVISLLIQDKRTYTKLDVTPSINYEKRILS